jgi:DNA helicase-2/ATP-dependent DNA helicase PcrA
VLRDMRGMTSASLPELVLAAERRLGIDIDLMARDGSAGARGHVEAFVAATRGFVADQGAQANLGAFLEWLEVAQQHERGLEPAPGSASPDKVQLITVHGAKGLEWDVVAVPGLIAGGFPGVSLDAEGEPKASGWMTALDQLPWPLRADAEALPRFDSAAAETVVDLADAWDAYVRAAGHYELAEDRRVAYVALTRAKTHMLVSGAWWGEQTKPRQPSVFLDELWAVGPELGLLEGPRAAAPEDDAANPLIAEPDTATWPVDGVLGARQAAVEAAAHAVRTAVPADLDHPAGEAASLARRLLVEQAMLGEPLTVELPASLSATQIRQRTQDPDGFVEQLARPVPRQPSRATRRGTTFHAWVEDWLVTHLTGGLAPEAVAGSAPRGPLTLPGSVDGNAPASEAEAGPGGEEDAEGEVTPALQRAFLDSEWARDDTGRRLVRAEQEFRMALGGTTVPGKIDAIFAEPSGEWTVVDWKTGRMPQGEDMNRAELQLRLYRLAAAQLKGLPVEDRGRIRAAFFYVEAPAGEQTHWLTTPATPQELEDLIARAT